MWQYVGFAIGCALGFFIVTAILIFSKWLFWKIKYREANKDKPFYCFKDMDKDEITNIW